MRQILAVAVLGASLAFTASAALADENGSDKVFQPTQSEVTIPQTDSSVVAGPTAPGSDGYVTIENSRDRN